MKLHQVENRADLTGAISSKKFDISFNAKMAGILSDGLYSYKIRAIIRELSTNAVDSHKAAGHQKPFDIHLPFWKEPYFYIRDYGTGLSKEAVEQVYSVYGESNKEDSNDFVGCLGLGSKTPFCYHTRTFTVESFLDGKRYLYNCFRDDTNMPSIAFSYEGDTTEPNGVKITVPTESYDEYEFQRECSYVYRFFDKVVPKFVGGVTPTIHKPQYTLEGKGWGYSGGECFLIMGGVCYPIKISLPGCQEILSNGFHIYANIGDVDIQPSREGLSYDPSTKAYISQRCQAIITEITDVASKSIANASSLWEAMCLYNGMNTTLPGDLKKCVDINQMLYKGQKLPLNPMGFIDVEPYMDKDEDYIRYFEYTHYKSTSPKREVKLLQPKTGEKYILDDLTVGAISRTQYYTNTNQKSTYLVKIKDLAKFCDYTGLQQSDFILASTLPASSVRGPSAARGKLDSVVKLKVGDNIKTQSWENVNINLEDGGIYVKFLRYDLADINGHYIHPDQIHKLNMKLRVLGITLPDIYGVKAKEVPELPDGWTCFWDWVKAELNKVTLTTNYQQCKHYQDQLRVRGYGDRHNYSSYNVLQGELFDELAEKVKIANSGLTELDKIEALRYIESNWGIKVQTDGQVEELGLPQKFQQINDRYPLLNYLSNLSAIQTYIQDYINAIEENNKCLS
jgi:hypothetical protein